jgi:Flp pilus assembly protein TadD
LGSTILAHAGRTAEAIAYGERAIRLSPRDPTIYLPLTALGIAHSASGNFEEAVVVCRKASQANPRFSLPSVLQTAALVRLGRTDEAKATARRVLELEPRFSVAVFVRSHTGLSEIWTPIGDALRQVDLPE